MLHAIFQRHHIPPDEVYRKHPKIRSFMYASMELQFEAEAEVRKEAAKRRKGGN